MTFRRTRDCDGELVAELLADELHQLSGIVQVAVGAGPAKGQVAAQRQHVVDAMIQIGLQLFTDIVLGIANAGEVGHGRALAVLLNLVQNLEVLAHVGSACAVGAGNVIRIQAIQLVQNAALAAQLFHADVRLRRENFKGKTHAILQDVCNTHCSFSS